MLRRAMPWGPPLLTAAAAAGVVAHAAWLRGPAEWRWEYSEAGLAGPWLWLAVALALAIVALGGSRGFAGRGRYTAVLLGAALSLSLITAEPGGWRRVQSALASQQAFGYLYDAGLAPDTGTLLRTYPAASGGLSMHSATHPPGPILGVRALDAVVGALPLPARLADGGAAALEREIRRARDHGRAVPGHLPAPATLVLLGWLLPALGAAVAWPLAVLARDLELAPEAASAAVALWLLVPARTVFSPTLDQAMPLLLVTACVAARRGRWGAALAGVLAGALVFSSFGFLAWLPVLGLLALTGAATPSGPRAWLARERWIALGAFLAGLIGPLALVSLASGFDPFAALRAALERHHAMAVATRSYWPWLLGNPADFGLLLGPGVLLAALYGALRTGAMRWNRAANLLAAAVGGLFLGLWLSGSVRGEVGRIWLFFMPFACLLAAPAIVEAAPRRALLAAEAALLLALAANLVFVR